MLIEIGARMGKDDFLSRDTLGFCPCLTHKAVCFGAKLSLIACNNKSADCVQLSATSCSQGGMNGFDELIMSIPVKNIEK